ncbi:SEL1-like repeat protein [Legionella septentrionalis]|uniref:Sel1 repeat family protein n=1 Tax=Legionella septentrionalis TaxID=2498109 RepID=A0A433JHL9_9GAMM|nr:sel1 repeat family protein [Legionella septentrionalis]RUQ82091.1 sel1 repeat family protein [Legionella septentrionalis]RUQ95530.1 sel1 repeat family protein [Legionella septentrionalis]RUR08928.1 sel1 repeat family protein [Legionella septentrionalis]
MLFLTKFQIKRLIKKIRVLQQSRLHNQPTDEALQKEVSLYHTLAALYESLQGKKKYPFAREQALECYRAATTINDPVAQYILGKNLLEEAKLREQLQKEEVFASTSNERRMKQLYEEALAYLTAAEKLQHIQAKRLHGLCYINGWGVEPDKKKGFDLIVASIDQENSWDKVPQIFASMGLNKPEFFSALAQHRKS